MTIKFEPDATVNLSAPLELFKPWAPAFESRCHRQLISLETVTDANHGVVQRLVLKSYGADGETRTRTAFATTPSR